MYTILSSFFSSIYNELFCKQLSLKKIEISKHILFFVTRKLYVINRIPGIQRPNFQQKQSTLHFLCTNNFCIVKMDWDLFNRNYWAFQIVFFCFLHITLKKCVCAHFDKFFSGITLQCMNHCIIAKRAGITQEFSH